MTYTVRLMCLVPDGGGVLPVWPLNIPPTSFVTVMQAYEAGNCEVLNMAVEGTRASFVVLNHRGNPIDIDGWGLNP